MNEKVMNELITLTYALGEHVKQTTIDFFNDAPYKDKLHKVILDNKKLIIDFLNSIESDVTERLTRGEEFEGYKLVQGRSTRKWNDEAKTALLGKLGQNAYTKKLIGVTEAQKQLGKEFVDTYTTKSEGKPTLVSSDDKRPSMEEINQ